MRAMANDSTMLHVYGWRRGDDGPYFLGNPNTVDEGISLAHGVLKDCRRGFVRAEIHDARAHVTVWHSGSVK
jgi:hypothetical protein